MGHFRDTLKKGESVLTVKITANFIKKIAAEKPEKVREFRDARMRGFVVRQQRSGFISYFAIVTRGSARRGNRRQKKIRIGEHPSISAMEAWKVAEELIAKAKLDALPIKREQDRITLKKFVDNHYIPWARHVLKALDAQVGQIRQFSAWNGLFLDEIDKHLVETWRNARIAGGASFSTANRNVAVIRSVLSKAVEWGFLEHHPLAGLKMLRIDRGVGPRVLTDEDRRGLFEALADRDKRLAAERRSANQWRAERRYELFPDLTCFGDHLTPIIIAAISVVTSSVLVWLPLSVKRDQPPSSSRCHLSNRFPYMFDSSAQRRSYRRTRPRRPSSQVSGCLGKKGGDVAT